MTSVFTALPQDMLQWEINRFLDPISRASWNTVLVNDERVFKKFPRDYAIKHHIKTVKKAHYSTVVSLNYFLRKVEDSSYYTLKAVNSLTEFFELISNPLNAVVFMYQRGLKEEIMNTLNVWCSEDNYLYTQLVCGKDKYLMFEAKAALAKVTAIPFVRHLDMKEFKSIY